MLEAVDTYGQAAANFLRPMRVRDDGQPVFVRFIDDYTDVIEII